MRGSFKLIDCLVINLARSTARMDFQRGQMAALGLGWRRIEAVTADEAAQARPETYWQRWERPMRPAERACLLSHVAAWERIAETGRPALILEDDAVLSRRVPAILMALEAMPEIDHVSLEVRKRRKLLGRTARPVVHGVVLRRLYQDRSGAAAYVLWPAGAAKLLVRAERGGALADALICKSYELESWQVEPASAIQLDRCEAYGIAAPIATTSTIDGAGKAACPAGAGYRLRRIAAQLRMGWRQLSLAFVAGRREVALDPGDFGARM